MRASKYMNITLNKMLRILTFYKIMKLLFIYEYQINNNNNNNIGAYVI